MSLCCVGDGQQASNITPATIKKNPPAPLTGWGCPGGPSRQPTSTIASTENRKCALMMTYRCPNRSPRHFKGGKGIDAVGMIVICMEGKFMVRVLKKRKIRWKLDNENKRRIHENEWWRKGKNDNTVMIRRKGKNDKTVMIRRKEKSTVMKNEWRKEWYKTLMTETKESVNSLSNNWLQVIQVHR